MLCQHCHEREATIHMTQNINGKVTELAICAQCAKEKKIQLPFMDDFGFSGLFSNFFGGEREADGGQMLLCPTCSSSLERFRQTGLLGCEDCYDTFSKEIEPLIIEVQGTDSNEGKTPLREADETEEDDEIKVLKQQLEEAIRNEDYELAAKLRDEIRGKEGRKTR